MTVINVLQYFL